MLDHRGCGFGYVKRGCVKLSHRFALSEHYPNAMIPSPQFGYIMTITPGCSFSTPMGREKRNSVQFPLAPPSLMLHKSVTEINGGTDNDPLKFES